MDEKMNQPEFVWSAGEQSAGDFAAAAQNRIGGLLDGVVTVSAYDSFEVCIARDTRPAMAAYTSAIDVIDDPVCRRVHGIRRVVAEQHGGGSPAMRWAMVYDERGALIEAAEQTISAGRAGDGSVSANAPLTLDSGVRLARRLRWIGVPGAFAVERQRR